jgi:hypothetical protein
MNAPDRNMPLSSDRSHAPSGKRHQRAASNQRMLGDRI